MPRVSDRCAGLAYADQRTALDLARSEAYYDAGYERGRVEALAAARQAGRTGGRLARNLVETLAASEVAPGEAVVPIPLGCCAPITQRLVGRLLAQSGTPR